MALFITKSTELVKGFMIFKEKRNCERREKFTPVSSFSKSGGQMKKLRTWGDLWLFPKLKGLARGKRFQTTEDIRKT